jgi:hypothetical protein
MTLLSVFFQFALTFPWFSLTLESQFNENVKKLKDQALIIAVSSNLIVNTKKRKSGLCHQVGKGSECDQSPNIKSHRQGCSDTKFWKFPKSATISFLNHPQGPIHLCGFTSLDLS